MVKYVNGKYHFETVQNRITIDILPFIFFYYDVNMCVCLCVLKFIHLLYILYYKW